MAEGFEVILKLNLPPEANYHSGHSVIIQGHTPEEVAKQVQSLVPGSGDGVGYTVLRRFLEHALLPAVKAELQAEAQAPAPDGADGDEELAGEILKKFVVKKTGRPIEELEGITKADAQALIAKEGK